ncbi:MAG: 23S rRNA (adenine(2503)-C(2))-methyltransferase RlmN [Deltaproteobacteria bacterium]|nr:23S rRNA (adenine(2503)-C(2))-methyltransferase RlmN [Deltaproteobacteria bacterium]MBN2670521.1 23S rRNA (adenine(2503)-C(2))-methyltransferase RlmN [Deltaproteobacteria bacterium]
MNFEDYQIVSSTPDELKQMFAEMGVPPFRAAQLFDWIHKKGVLAPAEMTNLPENIKAELARSGALQSVQVGDVFTSVDGTRKLEIMLRDEKTVETVLIPDGAKLTQCISSQVGCSVGCEFCRSGKFGFKRNLTAAEIIGQVLVARDYYNPGEQLTNVVFMGIGEPLHNYDNVLRTYQLLCHPDGLNLSSRKVTISTAGILRGIEKLGRDTDGKAALAISLHAADEATRRRLVTGMKASLAEIIDSLKKYPLPKRRRFTIEYVLVKGVNDSDEDARNLVRLLNPIPVKVNLLPLNPHDLSDMEPPDDVRVAAFQQILVSKGISVFMRKRRGDDIKAACGQLLGKKEES